jgi:hypothetical protein
VEIVKQPREPRLAAAQVVVMSERLGRLESLHAWLFGIDLPWMDVKDVGPVAPEDAPDAMREQAVREEAKVAPARPGHADTAEPERAYQDLVQSGPDLRDAFAGVDASEATVATMHGSWKGGRIVFQTEFLKDVQGPVGDAEGRRPIATDLLPAHRLNEANAALDVLPKHSRREGVKQFVSVTVAGDLVPGGGHPLDQSGAFFGHPAEHETGATHIPLGHEFQHAFRVPLDPQLPLIPGIACNHGF